ncbi:hypothetical protein TNCV_3123741 [Trichonephila clavipes]|nr:hypothetical protein TNCV_3123741 [Trichonephila clavipes]
MHLKSQQTHLKEGIGTRDILENASSTPRDDCNEYPPLCLDNPEQRVFADDMLRCRPAGPHHDHCMSDIGLSFSWIFSQDDKPQYHSRAYERSSCGVTQSDDGLNLLSSDEQCACPVLFSPVVMLH